MSNIKIKNQQFTETIFDILRDMGLGQRYTDGNWSYQKFKINNGNKFGEFGKGAETVRNQKKIEAVLELLGVGKAAIFNEHSNYIELSFIPYTNDKFKDSVFRKDNRDKKRIISLLKFLSAKTGVEFEEITREQADRHTKRRNKNFKIRGANIAGKAYIVTSGGDNATSEIAAEEMLHPLVEFLHRENGKLYNQLLLEARKSFPTLFAETTANYGEIGRFYEDKDGQIRLRGSNTIADRELVTQALARIFDNKWEDVDDSQRQSFKDLIIEFLNIVKEWFSQWVTKKSDGTVEFNLKDLPETTTLNELVDLLNTKLDVILGFENVMEDMENSVRYNKINEQNTTIPDIISEIEDNIC